MAEIVTMDIPDTDLSLNDEAATELRNDLEGMGIYMTNILGAPCSGRTLFLEKTIEVLKESYQIGVICADIDTDIDAQEISKVCNNVVQMYASGAEPFLHAEGARAGLMELLAGEVNVVFAENVGGLFSPVIYDTGARKNIAVISVTDGENIPLKYSFMFMVCDAVIINKTDLLSGGVDTDLEKLKSNILSVNENAVIFPVSAKTGEGMDEWNRWITRQIWESL